jgi:pimeloyl-ACP methyl ester carboxylesterase
MAKPGAPGPVKEKSFLGLTTQGFHRVAYTEWGQRNDQPTVVCVHGFSRNGRDFDFLASALQPVRRVVCPDMAGRGRSDWLADKQNYSFITYCADMTALLARLETETVDWIGTSMGGLIGMILAAQPRSPIRRLVVNDSGPFIPKAAPKRIVGYVGAPPAFASMDEGERYLRTVLAPFGALTDEQWAHMARHSVRESPDGGYRVVYDPGIVAPMKSGPIQDLDLWPVWDRIQCPVLVLRGTASDVLLPDTAAEMQRRGPRAEVVEFEGVGHAPALMAPEQIDAVRRWLLDTSP